MKHRGNLRVDNLHVISCLTDIGSTDSYAVANTNPFSSYTTGLLVTFKASSDNTGPCTLDVDGMGPKTLKKSVSDDLVAGDILTNQIVMAVYDGTNFQVIGTISTGGSTAISDLTSATGSNFIDNGDNIQYWEWNTLGNNYGLVLNTTSTQAAGGNQTMLKITMSGVNDNSNQKTFGQTISNNHSGSGSINIALQLLSALGDLNYALIVGPGDGQVGIGNITPDPSALVDIFSIDQGFLPPRMTGAQVEAISSPAEGLLAYATNAGSGDVTSKGWWGYDGTNWVKLN